MEFDFMTADTVLPPCMPLPTAMLRLPVSSTAKVMYARLLDATLAEGAEDTNGILFVRFPIVELAAVLSRSSVTVKRSLKELEDAGLMLATPVYFYSMDGQLKTLIDRTLPRYTEIRDKEVYFIATAAAGRGAMERTADAMRGFTDCLPGAEVKGVVYGSGVYQKGEVMDTKAFQEAYRLGKKV